MSRYKQAITGDVELDNINGVTPIIYYSIEDKFECLSIIKDNLQKKDFDLQRIRKFLNKVLQEGCFNHDANGRRTGIKISEAAGEETLVKDIDDFVVTNLSAIFTDIAIKLGFMTKTDVADIEKQVKQKQLSDDELKN